MVRSSLALLAVVLSWRAASADDTIRIITYNIHHGEGTDGRLDLDRIARVIREARADIVCLQEVDRGLPRTDKLDFPALLADCLGMRAVFEPNLQFDGGDYGNMTLTNLEIVSVENLRLPGPEGREPRGCLRTVLRVSEREIDVLNTHLGLESAERQEQAAVILERLSDRPTVLAGDLNEAITDPALGMLTRVLRDTAAPGVATFPAATPKKRIDFILASDAFEAVSADVLSSPDTAVASDHRPFVAELRWSVPERSSGHGGGSDIGEAAIEKK
ncbi:MAG TPA: endonuclease/exonuclease/phosphatase family protein [Candidatus Hydrogenedentes bacterium]|nr:endonuclease/exonuclease/phosphatase family protein [Candidatus Hydrogenedentota bacterium]HPG65588.1 endonuclease/exonuclease/phosphatase family protein [Candidatus Hydrogenedentota bacterium]